MRILCLYNNNCALPLFDWLRQNGHEVILCSERFTEDWCRGQEIDLTVSYTYRYILEEQIILALKKNIVNLHNSFLPWNRGKDPNLWSIVNNTPRGVTLHYVSPGLDKGDIIVQRLVPLSSEDTLETSYYTLDRIAQEQFREAFHWYEYWPQMRKTPLGKGSYHSEKDGAVLQQLIDTYDMPVEEFLQRVKKLDIKSLDL